VEQTDHSDSTTRLKNFVDRRAILRDSYFAAFRKAIVLVNALTKFGSQTNEANLWIREPFVTFGRVFEQPGKLAAPREWGVTMEQLAAASRGGAERIKQINDEENLERSRGYASSLYRSITPPLEKPPIDIAALEEKAQTNPAKYGVGTQPAATSAEAAPQRERDRVRREAPSPPVSTNPTVKRRFG
jgi:hypothetical protein